MSLIPQPSLGDKRLPISIDLAAVSRAQHLAKRLVRFGEGRKGESPSWDGRGGNMTEGHVGVPVTDRSYWEGRYVLCPLTLCDSEGNELEIVDAIATVSREYRIVSTALTGKDGTVKEYVNAGDWVVNLVVGVQPVRSGEIVDEWPDDEIRRLRQMLERGEALEVRSAFLDVFHIRRIVIRSYGAAQATAWNYQSLSINAVSDEECELVSNKY